MGDEDTGSSFRFLPEAGEEGMLVRAFDDSLRNLFCGSLAVAMIENMQPQEQRW
jgi:hypothetical protein